MYFYGFFDFLYGQLDILYSQLEFLYGQLDFLCGQLYTYYMVNATFLRPSINFLFETQTKLRKLSSPRTLFEAFELLKKHESKHS